MLRDITLGQYYPADSVVHKLDPRVKLFATMIYIIALFTFRGILGFATITGMLIFMIKISKVPFSYIVKGLKAIVVLLLITAVFNLVFTPTGTEYWHWGPFHLTSTGIMNAVLMTIRLIYLIIGTSLMTLTTTPNQLTDGLEKALSPLNRIHIPVHAIAMMMSIALRFIPILIEETDKIMKAQMARGADFEDGNLSRGRSCHGHGSPLLQWRRGTNKDETAALSGNRPQSLCDIDCISCACDCCTSAVALATVAGR